MGNKRNFSVIVAIRVILRFVKDFDGRIFPLLGDFSSCYPYNDDDAVEALDEFER